VVKEFFWSSRPASWINTALPFLAAALSVKLALTPLLIVGLVYFLLPYNLLLYGVNDLFDYESDRRNPRKGGVIEGGLLPPARAAQLWVAIALTNLPLLAIFAYLGGWRLLTVLVLTCLTAIAYSAPPLRTKVIPLLDSITSSSHFVLPAVCGLLAAGLPVARFPWLLLGAFFLWGVASQALGAIQDVDFDMEAGIGSIATVLGARRTAAVATASYALSVLLVSLGGGLELVAALTLAPYALLAASCLAGTPGIQGRRAWRSFLQMNLLAGFVITQLFLRQWGVDRIGVLELLAWGSALGVAASLLILGLNRASLRKVNARPGRDPLPSLTVIVLAAANQGPSRACIEHLRAQKYPGPLRFLAVRCPTPNGSPAPAEASLAAGIETIDPGLPPPNWSDTCWAAESGYRLADSDLLAFVDSDTELTPSALAAMASGLSASGAGLASLLLRQSMGDRAARALVPAFSFIQSCWLPNFLPNGGRLRRLRWPSVVGLEFGSCTMIDVVTCGRHLGAGQPPRDVAGLRHLLSKTSAAVIQLDGSALGSAHRYRSAGDVARVWRTAFYPAVGNSLPLALSGLIGILTVQLLPLALPWAAWAAGSMVALAGSLVALALLLLLRVLLARQQGQPLSTIVWHPVTWVATMAFQVASIAAGLRGEPGNARESRIAPEPLGASL
jgi:4-hydroxybenzoate polyprenyltransferase